MTLREHISALTTRKQNSIMSATVVLAITFGLSAILGFLRSRFLYSRFFGCCVLELDAYNAAFRIPDLIFKLLVTGTLSASFIPVFSSYLHKDENTAYKIASTVINLLLAIFILASLIVLLFTRTFSSIIASGFSPDQIDLMVNLTRILLVAQIFFLISNFFTGILQVNQVFIIPALSPIVYNFFIILSIFTLAPIFGIYGVTYGAVIGAFFHLAIQIPVVKKLGFRYSLTIDPGLKGVHEIIRLMVPRSLSLGLGEIENTVTLFFASNLAAGSISLLNLALQLMYLPSRIFGTTIGQASLPILSKNVARNELDLFSNTVKKTVFQSFYIAAPITTIVLVHRLAIVRIAFGAKQFPWAATLLTAKTLAFLTPAIICQAIVQILIRSFYALHNTKVPLYVSFVSLIANILTSFFFVNFTSLGIVGLAISASVGNLVQCLGLLLVFIKKVDSFEKNESLSRLLKITLANILMGFTTWSTLKIFDLFILDTTRTINVICLFTITSLAGCAVYILSSYFLAIPEFHFIYNRFSRISKLFFRVSQDLPS